MISISSTFASRTPAGRDAAIFKPCRGHQRLPFWQPVALVLSVLFALVGSTSSTAAATPSHSVSRAISSTMTRTCAKLCGYDQPATVAVARSPELHPRPPATRLTGWLLSSAPGRVARFVAAEGGSGAIVKYEPYPPNGGFLGEPVEDSLQPGARISRYGGSGGTYASPEDVPFGQRGLPPSAANSPYTTYEVVKQVDVQGGIAQYWMGGGGGVQYRFGQPIQELVDEGVLKVVGP